MNHLIESQKWTLYALQALHEQDLDIARLYLKWATEELEQVKE